MTIKAALPALLVAAAVATPMPTAANDCPPLLNHTFPRLQDEVPQSLCQYKGKVILVVNTASKCGFTGQYEPLEALYEKYRERGLVVVGFPSNDYGNQEPGDSKQIADFCRLTYGVQFPMMAKTDIAAPKTHPFYKSLIEKTGTRPKWNFHKYLIDRSGANVESFSTLTSPDSRSFVAAIEKRLAEKP
jgi:glutathione peroxidase